MKASARATAAKAATKAPAAKAAAPKTAATTSRKAQVAAGPEVRPPAARARAPRKKVAPPVLERWLSGDNAALAEMALLALRAQQPEREKPALEQALSL